MGRTTIAEELSTSSYSDVRGQVVDVKFPKKTFQVRRKQPCNRSGNCGFCGQNLRWDGTGSRRPGDRESRTRRRVWRRREPWEDTLWGSVQASGFVSTPLFDEGRREVAPFPDACQIEYGLSVEQSDEVDRKRAVVLVSVVLACVQSISTPRQT